MPGMTRKESSSSTNEKSPISPKGPFAAPLTNGFMNKNIDANKIDFSSNNFEDLNGLFSPSVLETASRSNSTDYMSYNGGKSASPNVNNGSISNTKGQQHMPKIQQRTSSTSITASPVSSMSQNGLDSSCGTTPESSADSPDNRKASEATLNTINEETITQNKPEGKKDSFCDDWAKACGNIANPIPPMLSESNGAAAPLNFVKTPNTDINGIDWMAQQNGGQFDPVLFGDYRDPQDSILNNSFGEFFNDAFPSPQDFTSPYNTGEAASQSQPQKRDLMQGDRGSEERRTRRSCARRGSATMADGEEVPGGNPKQFLTCDKLWSVASGSQQVAHSTNMLFHRDRVQASEKVKSGVTDMDDLCSQLKAKAKCSGSGAVIDQAEVDRILGPAPTEQQDFLKMFT